MPITKLNLIYPVVKYHIFMLDLYKVLSPNGASDILIPLWYIHPAMNEYIRYSGTSFVVSILIVMFSVISWAFNIKLSNVIALAIVLFSLVLCFIIIDTLISIIVITCGFTIVNRQCILHYPTIIWVYSMYGGSGIFSILFGDGSSLVIFPCNSGLDGPKI